MKRLVSSLLGGGRLRIVPITKLVIPEGTAGLALTGVPPFLGQDGQIQTSCLFDNDFTL